MTENNEFELVREQHLAEINSRARLYRHIETGAELLSIENDDENKVFGITFRTPPADSTGLPHIMEHSVLCGSRKYPVKEPFVELMKGSLNTFLNAMTFPDKTCYPVASQNLQDFHNLVDVYLDAVFFPRLTPYTLMQEGWHYELENPQDPLSFKGVVFNEMKGAYSDPDSVLGEQIQHAIFPENEYRHDSGGSPSVIPDLTFEQFQAFHETYYHPSNARIFFYGDDDPEQRLSVVHDYLHLFDPIPVKSEISLQKPFSQPRRQVIPYEIAAGQEDARSFVTVNWLLPENGDPELVYGLAILEQALIGNPAAQLRKALIDSGLGEDITGSGFESSTRQMFFSIGLKGVAAENIEKVEALIQDTLNDIAKTGVDKDNIAAAINTIEFRLRENNTGSYPRGLSIMLRSLDFWLYGKDPLAPLMFEAPLSTIKQRLDSGEVYFEKLIEKYLVNNAHRVHVILSPDATLGEKRAAAERERLDKARASMDDTALAQILENTRQLKLRQETPDSPEMLMTIPMLEREDLGREIRHIPVEVLTRDKNSHGAEVLYHDLFTNGILYLDLGFDLHVLPQEWIAYIPLFGRALTETGTAKESFVQLLQRIGRNTGGIRPSTFTSSVRKSNNVRTMLMLRGKAMTAQAGELLSILSDVLTGANLQDRERFRQMALEEKARLEARLAAAGHGLVNSRLRARFNEADWAAEQMSGASYLLFLRSLTQQIDQDWPAVLEILESIRAALITAPNALCNITLDAANWSAVRPQLEDFLAALPKGMPESKDWVIPGFPGKEGLTIPSQVNFVGKGANLYALGYEFNGSVLVINNHLNGAWLWDKIRVQGGAYGGFAVFDSQSGILNYLSYRDPNLQQSLQTYDQTGAYLKDLELDESELTKSIIGTIGDLDSYLLPDAKGYTSMRWYLLGTTDEERQKLRDEVLNTTLEDFHRFGEVLDAAKDQSAVVVLGAEDAVQNAAIFDEIKKLV